MIIGKINRFVFDLHSIGLISHQHHRFSVIWQPNKKRFAKRKKKSLTVLDISYILHIERESKTHFLRF
jgi:hypothetical protein